MIVLSFSSIYAPLLQNIPNIQTYPLTYVFEKLQYKHTPDTLWLEFGVATGKTINYISSFTKDKVYGFDSFEGLPEKWRSGYDKGMFDRHGMLPEVNDNVVLIKGWFCDTLYPFIREQNKKVSFIHMDCDLYSSTITVLDILLPYLEKGCIIIFDELVNYEGFNGETGELKALYEFINKNNIKFEWIGMDGRPFMGNMYRKNQIVALRLL